MIQASPLSFESSFIHLRPAVGAAFVDKSSMCASSPPSYLSPITTPLSNLHSHDTTGLVLRFGISLNTATDSELASTESYLSSEFSLFRYVSKSIKIGYKTIRAYPARNARIESKSYWLCGIIAKERI